MSIRVEGLTKRFGRTLVVDRVTLEVEEHELFVLLGTSGSGKSTILRIVAGLAEPDSGRVVLRGRDVTDLPPQARGIGFVFQDYSLFRHMSVGENVEFGLRIRKVRPSERSERRDELLDLVGLGGHSGKFPRQLSGGQKQRVALARALAYRPDVLLLDEPFGALDARTRAQLRRTLREIQDRLGVTTILVTHDQDEAFELADRIGVLDRGRLLEVGSPEQLYLAPRTHFAATFVGAGAVLVGHSRGGRAWLGDVSLPLPRGAEDPGRVHVLVRPEQVVVTEPGTAPPDPGVQPLGRGVVLSETFAGPLRRVRVAVARPPGVRQVSPVLPFGEERLLLDAAMESGRPRPATGELDVALRGWHVLDPAPPRVLVVDATLGPAFDVARTLTDAIRGSLTVLSVVPDAESTEAERARLSDALAARTVARAEARVRVGDLAMQALLEQHETFHAVVVVPSASGDRADLLGGGRAGLGPVALDLLARAGSPLLLVPAPRETLRNLLVCTAVGEPGEHAVRLGGWLARRLHSRVTLLHVLQGTSSVGARASLHLARAEATLRALEVPAVVRTRPARTAAEGIRAEANEGDHDLVVIGRHESAGASLVARDNVTLQVLLGTRRPVLVVSSGSA